MPRGTEASASPSQLSEDEINGELWKPGPDAGEIAKRLENIRELQRQATYPLNTVGCVRAQSQLAHVEVPWLTSQLENALISILDLEVAAQMPRQLAQIIA
jgi:hypothetical protein